MLVSTSPFAPNQWVLIEVIWEDENTVVVRRDGNEVMREILPGNVFLESGKIHLDQGTGEAWFDDIVVCGPGTGPPETASNLVSRDAPPEQHRRLMPCGAGLCAVDSQGGSTPILQAGIYSGFNGYGWSPDGQQIVFSACQTDNTSDRKCGRVYLADASGESVTPLQPGSTNHELVPAWSPDGQWIAYHDSGSLSIVRPDGSLYRSGPHQVCPSGIAWSPDSQRIAFTADMCGGAPETVTAWVTNLDGDDTRLLLTSTDPPIERGQIAWTPDGESIVLTLTNGRSYLIDADCTSDANGCDESAWTATGAIPEHWLNTYLPQWAGEATVATTEPPSGETPTEQAENFAAPILAAIADRPPDYEDDFSDPTSGWPRGVIPDNDWTGGEIGYTDGEYFIVASPAGVSPVHSFPLTCTQGDLTTISFSDMVLEIEVRFLEEDQYMWSVDFRRSESPEGDLGYFLHADPSGLLALHRDEQPGETVRLGELRGLPMQAGLETNRLQIVAVGPQFAVYVNGEPALFATDRYFDEQYSGGWIRLKNCNESDTPREVRFDNLRIWDISDL
jgi:hypothetical protein